MRIQAIAADYAVPSNLSQVACANGLYLEVDTTDEVNITLPPVGTYPKIIVLDATGNAAAKNITITAADGEKVEGAETASISKAFGSTVLIQASATSWDEFGDSVPVEDVTLTKTVDIASAAILTSGSSPVTLLDPPGAGKYYEIDKAILEYTHVGTAYTTTGITALAITVGTTQYLSIEESLLSVAANRVAMISGTTAHYSFAPAADDYPMVLPVALNQGVKFTNWPEVDPTLGDGTLKVILTYKVRTFGA